GDSLGAADNMRRIMGKKKPEVLAREFDGFEAGMIKNGFAKPAIKKLWDVLVPFAEYAFNKSHSAAYGVITYWTAYLKANYPAEYMAALLQGVTNDKDKMGLYLSECRRMGIKVLPPDVNASAAKFAAVGTDIRFGLVGVRNVGEGVVDAIVTTRATKGAYAGFTDFLDKVPVAVCNKRTVESLIKAGAFDSLEPSRKALLVVHEPAVDAVMSVKRKEAEGQFDLFADIGGEDDQLSLAVEVPELPDWEKKQKLAFEKEMLGLYVSDHPLAGLESVLARSSDTTVASLHSDEGRADGEVVQVAGLISAVQRKMSKKGRAWAAVTIEDLEGSIEALFFSNTYDAHTADLAEDQVVSVRGRIRLSDDKPMVLTALEMAVLETTAAGAEDPVQVNLAAGRCNEPTLARVKEILTAHPGLSEVRLAVIDGEKRTLVKVSDSLRVAKGPALFGDLKALLGAGCL
ncbi:MAG: OB-fold nucleic acid binding domain-containing protein, partial [Promicromonosporaceae bacterium]|nr:OB-fold nucleic acid binding domain-containing protein [Promicromonosporaceae bacterium]